MNNYFILVFAIVISIAYTDQIDKDFQSFQDFMIKYNKTYQTPGEMLEKYRIFKANLKSIKQSTPKQMFAFSKASGTLKGNQQRFGPNQFADWTPAEFKMRYLTLDVSELQTLRTLSGAEEPTLKKEEIPENFDWRWKGAVTPVRNQDECGGCWSFTTVATWEAQYFIKTNQLMEFSEQHLIDCNTSNKACRGGVLNKAFDYLKTSGLVERSTYPYINSKNDECLFDQEHDQQFIKVKDYKFIYSQDEQQMKAMLIEHGPLAAAVNGFPLMFYLGGIFDPWFDWMCSSNVDHAITIVGYGKENDTEFWIIKNSWGDTWGENGYLRLALGRGLCGINKLAFTVEGEVIN